MKNRTGVRLSTAVNALGSRRRSVITRALVAARQVAARQVAARQVAAGFLAAGLVAVAFAAAGLVAGCSLEPAQYGTVGVRISVENALSDSASNAMRGDVSDAPATAEDGPIRYQRGDFPEGVDYLAVYVVRERQLAASSERAEELFSQVSSGLFDAAVELSEDRESGQSANGGILEVSLDDIDVHDARGFIVDLHADAAEQGGIAFEALPAGESYLVAAEVRGSAGYLHNDGLVGWSRVEVPWRRARSAELTLAEQLPEFSLELLNRYGYLYGAGSLEAEVEHDLDFTASFSVSIEDAESETGAPAFKAAIEDAENAGNGVDTSDLTYRWFLDGDGEALTDGTGSTVELDDVDPGNYLLSLLVYDEDGKAATAGRAVYIEDRLVLIEQPGSEEDGRAATAGPGTH